MTWLVISSIVLFNLVSWSRQSQASPRSKDMAKHRDLLLVVNQGNRSMSIVDPVAGVQIGKVKTHGEHAHEVTASPDGRLALSALFRQLGRGQARHQRQ